MKWSAQDFEIVLEGRQPTGEVTVHDVSGRLTILEKAGSKRSAVPSTGA